jgi:hypothetical protein
MQDAKVKQYRDNLIELLYKNGYTNMRIGDSLCNKSVHESFDPSMDSLQHQRIGL